MVPATQAPRAVAQKEQRRLMTILKDDHGYDVIKSIVDEIGFIQRSKKIKPLEKRRLLKDYNLSLLSYCMPKMKIVEDDKGNQTPINFQINIENNNAPQQSSSPRPAGKGKGIQITIPTNKNQDGAYTVPE